MNFDDEAIAATCGIDFETVTRKEALRPMNCAGRRSANRPENFDEIIAEAILLKRQIPQRSARVIIKILEIEGMTLVSGTNVVPLTST